MSVWWMGSEFSARIVDTDYDTFSLTYMCQNLDNNKRVEKWGVNIRDPDASEVERQRIMKLVYAKLAESQKDVAVDQVFTADDLSVVKQGRSVCQYYGEQKAGGN